MGILYRLGITLGEDNIASKVFESLHPNFFDFQYAKPSEYVLYFWNEYQKSDQHNNNLNGKLFEYILATLFIREGLLPLFVSAKVAFVPNVIYDLMFYSSDRGPICISAKTSLRERYKQADLESIALKYVHRRALSYLLTLDEKEAERVKNKIKRGDVIGIDDVIIANNSDLDKLVCELKKYSLLNSPTVEVIETSQIVTNDKVKSLLQ
jgi:hypothetical protein